MAADITIRPAQADDLAVAKDWLAAANLPTEDLTASHMDAFLVAAKQETVVALVGLESHGDVGLLRSLIVDKECRGQGLGAQLVAELESVAAANAMSALWLLTIDSDPFFARLGYEVMQRSDAPRAIQSTPEFSSLCPADAVLMRKYL